MSKKGNMVRVNKQTVLAVNMIAGQLKGETGREVSAGAVIWDLIERLYPDIAKQAVKKASQDKTKVSDEGGGDEEG